MLTLYKETIDNSSEANSDDTGSEANVDNTNSDSDTVGNKVDHAFYDVINVSTSIKKQLAGTW